MLTYILAQIARRLGFCVTVELDWQRWHTVDNNKYIGMENMAWSILLRTYYLHEGNFGEIINHDFFTQRSAY